MRLGRGSGTKELQNLPRNAARGCLGLHSQQLPSAHPAGLCYRDSTKVSRSWECCAGSTKLIAGDSSVPCGGGFQPCCQAGPLRFPPRALLSGSGMGMLCPVPATPCVWGLLAQEGGSSWFYTAGTAQAGTHTTAVLWEGERLKLEPGGIPHPWKGSGPGWMGL